MSVDEYYRNNFGKFSNSRLPCVICEGGMNSSGIKYYLMEHLLIVENQSWDNFDDMSEEEVGSFSILKNCFLDSKCQKLSNSKLLYLHGKLKDIQRDFRP